MALNNQNSFGPGAGVRVLVVEDEPIISQVCQRALTRDGYAVDIVVDGQAAQVFLIADTTDICLIDIRTPRMSGEELFRWITVNHPELVSGIILTTGDIVSQETSRFVAEAKRPTLPKPFSPSDLLDMVNSVAEEMKRGTV